MFQNKNIETFVYTTLLLNCGERKNAALRHEGECVDGLKIALSKLSYGLFFTMLL